MTTVGYVYGQFQKVLLAAGWQCVSHSPGIAPMQRIAIFKRGNFEHRLDRSDTFTTCSNRIASYGFDGKYFVTCDGGQPSYVASEEDFWASFEESIY